MIDATGISTCTGTIVRWSEIVAVSAHKVDAKTRFLTYLVFGHECGEFLEFMNEDPDFQAIIDSLDRFLNLSQGWRSKLEAATPQDDILELWKRPAR